MRNSVAGVVKPRDAKRINARGRSPSLEGLELDLVSEPERPAHGPSDHEILIGVDDSNGDPAAAGRDDSCAPSIPSLVDLDSEKA